MNDDDAAYTALLTQLLSDTSSSRNQRVHSWIEHQYDFALSEESIPSKVANDDDKSYLSFSCPSRTPSPSPSSSLGAHRTFSIDRPDSPLLPRMSAECGRLDGAGTRPRTDSSARAPSYDALFFPAPSSPELLIEDEEREERERERALRFLVQEMANWRMQNSPITPHKGSDKVSTMY
ncbi:hypothetical protein BV22DRAFT_749036 [Leucogyrophana mollusca]|uniref:Uncharacterized protein n=1 Tax=Leucogyrophana mollusca TaxID=85980 RepID=A0ACB8B688_9AGAM|nr:hypothetical protein BV22DRAFT_749036 [Leucogyrophana mollusca]